MNITCEVPGIAPDAISWDGVYSVQDNSSVLMLDSVNSTLNGTKFTCSVNSSLIHSQLGSKEIMVTVKSMF